MRRSVAARRGKGGSTYATGWVGRGESLFGPLEGTDEEINERQRVKEKGIR